jgi:DNA-directed RNA polymerase specialized sigma24 family protein
MKGNADTISFASQEQSKLAESTEIFWAELYLLLRPLVKRWVYNSGVSSWRGQEDDVSEDIVQEAVYRLLKYALNADKGEAAPIEIPEHMVTVIAHNCFIDKWRKDSRLVRYDTDDRSSLEHLVKVRTIDPSEVASDCVYYAWLFLKLADFVVTVSTKQKTALLRDLAQRMHFGNSLTQLQKAFADKGMELRAHQGWRGKNKREQSQHAANLSLALRQIKKWAAKASL